MLLAGFLRAIASPSQHTHTPPPRPQPESSRTRVAERSTAEAGSGGWFGHILGGAGYPPREQRIAAWHGGSWGEGKLGQAGNFHPPGIN